MIKNLQYAAFESILIGSGVFALSKIPSGAPANTSWWLGIGSVSLAASIGAIRYLIKDVLPVKQQHQLEKPLEFLHGTLSRFAGTVGMLGLATASIESQLGQSLSAKVLFLPTVATFSICIYRKPKFDILVHAPCALGMLYASYLGWGSTSGKLLLLAFGTLIGSTVAKQLTPKKNFLLHPDDVLHILLAISIAFFGMVATNK